MYICICHSVSESDIEAAIAAGANTMRHLRETLRVSTQCGSCAQKARTCLEKTLDRETSFADISMA